LATKQITVTFRLVSDEANGVLGDTFYNDIVSLQNALVDAEDEGFSVEVKTLGD
jgi:hypothetical protein